MRDGRQDSSPAHKFHIEIANSNHWSPPRLAQLQRACLVLSLLLSTDTELTTSQAERYDDDKDADGNNAEHIQSNA